MANFCKAIAFLSLAFVVARCQEETECRGKPVDLTDKEKAVITDCLKEADIHDIWKIPLVKLPCFSVCILKEKDLLTKDGKISLEKSTKYIKTHFKDKETQKMLIDATEKCIKEHGDAVVVAKDPHCHKFLDVGQCVHDAFLDICVEDGKKPEKKA